MESLGARLKDIRAWGREVAFAAGLAVFFALIGPFGSYAEPLPRRLAVSFAYALAGLPFWGPGYRTLTWFADRWGAPRLLGRILAVLAVTVPITAVVRVIGMIVYQHAEPAGFLRTYLSVNTIALPLAVALTVIAGRVRTASGTAAVAEPAAAPSPAAPRLNARLPAAVDGPILALQAEDHYVRVHTERGSALLLMRMSDAVAELDGLAGLQVHRSWWVARAAVAGAVRNGRRAEIVLRNGLSAPVSRAAMAEARAAGYLAVRA